MFLENLFKITIRMKRPSYLFYFIDWIKVHLHIYSLIQEIICCVSTMCQKLSILSPGNIAINESDKKKIYSHES